MIDAQHLTKVFGDFVAVNDVSFTVKDGEIFGIVGPNGAGKSTIVKMLCTILEPTSGTALINGYDIRRDAQKIRHMIGYLPEEPRMYDGLTALEYLDLFADMYDVSTDTSSLLSYVGLSEHAHRKVGDFSKGMRQRLSIARALVHEPDILILDEPTMGLDPSSARELREKILSMRREGKTIVLCTHYMDEADFLCDTLLILNNGRAAAYGTVEQLRETYAVQKKLRVGIRESVPITLLEEVLGGTRRGHGIEIPFSGSVKDAIQDVFRRAHTQGWTIVSLQTVYPSLEDVFIEVVKDKSFSSPLPARRAK